MAQQQKVYLLAIQDTDGRRAVSFVDDAARFVEVLRAASLAGMVYPYITNVLPLAGQLSSIPLYRVYLEAEQLN